MDIGCPNQEVAVDELGRDLGKFVRLDDLEHAPDGDGDDAEDGSKHAKKCFVKSPCGEKGSPRTRHDGDDESKMALRVLLNEEPVEPVQLHSPVLSLVSAIKGSREKVGASPRKLSVKWAPDVYDPVPNSLSHTVKGKQKSRKDGGKDYNSCSKKNKKGQKGKRGGGGGSKDKKQVRKHGGKPDNRGQRTVDAVDPFVLPTRDMDDFGVGSSDSCGRSSFLQESLTKIHYSVAEA